MLILTLSACHLFSSAEIPCTSDELPGCSDTAPETDTDTDTDADTDSDTDADADSDTDSDSDTDLVPSSGVVASIRNGSDWEVRVLDPQGSPLLSYAEAGQSLGPVAWDAEGEVVYLASDKDEVLYRVSSSGPVELLDLGAQAVDVTINGTWLYLSEGRTLARVSLASGEVETLSSGELEEVLQIVPDNDDGVYLIDRGSGSPSLLHWESTGLSLSVSNFDTVDARVVGAYLREGEVWGCSEGGGTWSIGQLKSGDTQPERLASGGITDVVDCGYDAGTDEVLFVSASKGVLRVDADNSTSEWASTTGLVVRAEVFE